MSSLPSSDSVLLTGFAPVISPQTHTLILGSFPGKASLEAGQYYAYKHNQFWRLLSAILQENLLSQPYEIRLSRLLARGLGLWDVFHRCQREGSLDAAIRHAEWNNFDALSVDFPALRRICFNGKTAATIERYFLERGFETLVLPSSSPANAMQRLEQKQEIWCKILQSD